MSKKNIYQNAMQGFFLKFLTLREAKLVGKAAFERILDVVFTASLCRIFQHVLMEFDAKFINNILAENSQAGAVSLEQVRVYTDQDSRHIPLPLLTLLRCFILHRGEATWQDSGNKVIQQFVKRVLTRSLHPMIDVMSLLIWKHVEICFTLANKPWSKDADNLKETCQTVGALSPKMDSTALHHDSLLRCDFEVDLKLIRAGCRFASSFWFICRALCTCPGQDLESGLPFRLCLAFTNF